MNKAVIPAVIATLLLAVSPVSTTSDPDSTRINSSLEQKAGANQAGIRNKKDAERTARDFLATRYDSSNYVLDTTTVSSAGNEHYSVGFRYVGPGKGKDVTVGVPKDTLRAAYPVIRVQGP